MIPRGRSGARLNSISSTGVYTSTYTTYEHDSPAAAIGPYFALRFTAYGSSATSSVSWDLDDVSVTPLYAPGDHDLDGNVDFADAQAFFACLAGPEITPAAGCLWGDLHPDLDVDLADFAEFQTYFVGGP